jgi:lactate permease
LQVFVGSFSPAAAQLGRDHGDAGVGYLTRYCGMDATMGMAMSHTGALFPFFGTMIGWLGVSLSGTDAGSNALFGSLQVITANKLGPSPILMGAANSAGGVMGKMIAAQSLVIGCAVTGQVGRRAICSARC